MQCIQLYYYIDTPKPKHVKPKHNHIQRTNQRANQMLGVPC